MLAEGEDSLAGPSYESNYIYELPKCVFMYPNVVAPMLAHKMTFIRTLVSLNIRNLSLLCMKPTD